MSKFKHLFVAAAALVGMVSGAFGAEPESVRIGYFANLTHAQAVLGVQSGAFASALSPSKLETRIFNAGPSLIEALNAGEIDIGYVGPGPAISIHGKSRGEAIRVIAGAAANGVVVVARKDSGIRSLDDLNGKRIATPQAGNTQDIAAKHFLKEKFGADGIAGIIPVTNAEQAGLMTRNQLDAAWVPEPWGAYLAAETGATIIAQEKDLWPEKKFVLTVVITTPKFLSEHPDKVEKFLAAHRAITNDLQKDPQALVPQLGEALFALTRKKLPDGVLKDAITRVEFTDEPLPQSLDAMSEWTLQLGYVRKAIKVDGLLDTTLLRKLQSAPATP